MTEYLLPFYQQDGEEIIKDFLTQVAKLSVETMTEEQLAHEMSILKDKMLARKDPYIQDLLANWLEEAQTVLA